MATDKQFSRIIPVGIILLLGLTGCPGPCPETVYNFAVTASFSPDKDSVKLGDTLFLQSSFPSQLRDVQTNKIVDYSNASAIGSNLFVDKLSTNPNSLGSYLEAAVTSFNYVSQRGQIYTDPTVPSSQRVKQLIYEQNGSNYELRAALIPLQRGLYSLSVTDGLSNSKRTSKDCSRAAFQMTLLSNKRSLPYLQVASKRPLNQNDSLHFYIVRVY